MQRQPLPRRHPQQHIVQPLHEPGRVGQCAAFGQRCPGAVMGMDQRFQEVMRHMLVKLGVLLGRDVSAVACPQRAGLSAPCANFAFEPAQ